MADSYYIDQPRPRRPVTVPAHVVETYGSPRRFRDLHRARIRTVLWALNQAQRASAWSPACTDLHNARVALEDALVAVSRERWGR